MKRIRIAITHQLEKTTHYFFVVDPIKLTRNEVERIKKKMNVDMVFVNGKLYK